LLSYSPSFKEIWKLIDGFECEKAFGLGLLWLEYIDHHIPELNPCCFVLYVRFKQTDFEVVKEGRILYFVKGYCRFKLVPIANDEKSSLVDKRFEISNLDLIRDMDSLIKLKEIL